MTSIARVVEHIVSKRPFLEEALVKGIINYAALAENLKPEIEQELNKEVKYSAIMMALRRFSEGMKGSFMAKSVVKLSESDITIKSDLFEITFAKSKDIVSLVKRIYDVSDSTKGDFLTVTQGLYEVTVIASKRHQKEIKKVLESEDIIKTIEHLSSLTVRIPTSAVETIGLFYTVTKALNWANISIAEIVSTLTELTFILKEQDMPLAFNTIKKLIEPG
jgi:aspartokinase